MILLSGIALLLLGVSTFYLMQRSLDREMETISESLRFVYFVATCLLYFVAMGLSISGIINILRYFIPDFP